MRFLMMIVAMVGLTVVTRPAHAADNYMEQHNIHDQRQAWVGSIKGISRIGLDNWTGNWDNCNISDNKCETHQVTFIIDGSTMNLEERNTNQFYRGTTSISGENHHWFKLIGIFGSDTFSVSGNVILP